MSDFWSDFLKVGIHPQKPDDGLKEALEFLNNNSLDEVPSKDQIISILFHRIDKTLNECYFGDVNELVISLLSKLAKISSINHLMQPGLYESIFVLFLNDEKTFDAAVDFLNGFFDRDDIENRLEDVIMVTIINLANYSPPKLPLWRFMCRFMERFGGNIESMCDFKAVESNGLLPIFTRSLIWNYRNIYQHPPEKQHEEMFWKLWKSILTRYKEASMNIKDSDEDKPPVIQLFFGLMNEIRLSIYFSLTSALKSKNGDKLEFVSETPLEVWKLLFEINTEEMIVFLESQFENDALRIALQASLSFINDDYKERINNMLSKY